MSRVVNPGGSEGEGAFAEELREIGPGSTVAGLDGDELVVLRQAWLRALPIDPSLHRFLRSLPVGRGRFATIDFVETGEAGAIVATEHAGAGSSRLSRAASRWRRVLLGAPLAGSALPLRMPCA